MNVTRAMIEMENRINRNGLVIYEAVFHQLRGFNEKAVTKEGGATAAFVRARLALVVPQFSNMSYQIFVNRRVVRLGLAMWGHTQQPEGERIWGENWKVQRRVVLGSVHAQRVTWKPLPEPENELRQEIDYDNMKRAYQRAQGLEDQAQSLREPYDHICTESEDDPITFNE